MKILLVQRFDLQTIACATRVIHHAEELARMGHEVTLTHFPHPDRQSKMPIIRETLPESVNILSLNRNASALAGNIFKISKIGKDVDVIHLWKCYPDAALPALFAAYRWNKPLHYDWDDLEIAVTAELTGSKGMTHIVKLFENRLPHLADTISVASMAIKQLALDLGVPGFRIWDAPVGVDTDQFKAEPEKLTAKSNPFLIYIGQLEVACYAEACIEVMPAVLNKFPGTDLYIVGGGKKIQTLKELVSKKNLNDSVTFTDYISSDKVQSYINKADVALCPLPNTPAGKCKSPLKIVEYLSMGKPIVAHAVGEAVHMVEDCGITVPPEDSQAWEDAILKLLEDNELRTRYGRNARRKAETKYKWSTIVEKLVEAYNYSIEGRKFRKRGKFMFRK